jgi:hypothetical protein
MPCDPKKEGAEAPASSPKSMEEKILEWLGTHGYPLEFVTAGKFRRAGFRVEQSSFVRDRETGKQREVDVLAGRGGEERGACIVLHVVECKFARSPFLVFSGNIEEVPSINASVRAHAVMEAMDPDELEEIWNLSPYRERSPVGFAGVRSLKEKGATDDFYEALCSVSSATLSLIESLPRDERLVVALPVIVVRGQLFEVVLDEKGELKVTEVEQSHIAWGGVRSENGFVAIDVVVEGTLDRFVQERAQDADVICAKLEAANRKLAAAECSKRPTPKDAGA